MATIQKSCSWNILKTLTCSIAEYQPVVPTGINHRVDTVATEALRNQKDPEKISFNGDVGRIFNGVHFPGERAKFEPTSQHWDSVNSTSLSEVVRSMGFLSTSSDSFFSAIAVDGYRSGRVALRVYIRHSEDRDLAKEYLQKEGIVFNSNDVYSFASGFYKTEDVENLKILFQILVKHNEIPQAQFKLIQSLVEKGDWKAVTPLQKSWGWFSGFASSVGLSDFTL